MSNYPTPSDFTPPELQEIAKLLPAYDILSFIAKGGMGAVYMARQKSLDRDVAIKILPRHFGEDAKFRASFEAEAKSMAKLNHPNLVSIYDFGQVDGLLYIIMEMVQETLYHSSCGKTINPSESAHIVIGICHGLAHAHQQGILHRDIKPANILLGTGTLPKIGDFGLARPVGSHESDSAFGTPGYTAPEVIHNPSTIDESTDIYAVGAILYELLTSKLPDSNYTPVTTLVHCDPRFDQIICKAMHATPALRYRNANEMAKALESIKFSSVKLLHPASKPTTSTARTLITSSSDSKKTVTASKNFPGNRSTLPQFPIKRDAHSPCIRNIIVIVALSLCTYIAWEGLKILHTKRTVNGKTVEKMNDKRKRENKAQKVHAKTNALKHKISLKPNPPKSSVRIETPRETLSRLKFKLLKGIRSEMPGNSVVRAGRSRFFIEEKMTWHKAQEFCENHGGHLAVLPEISTLQWLCSKLKPDQTIWLGAGSATHGEWRWIDGTPWKHKIRKTSRASYVAVDDTTILDPQTGQSEHSFFIEWSMDGSTLASLENQLKRCAESLLTNTPLFPAGTVSYDNRHYLLIQKNAKWKTARSLAHLAGGTLSTPSNPDENEWMLGFLASVLQKDQVCWIGGICNPNQPWKWSTGEPWKFDRWSGRFLDQKNHIGRGCAVTPAQVWNDYPLDSVLPCFLIEWSKDGQGYQTVKNTGSIKAREITPTPKKCDLLIQSLQKRCENNSPTISKAMDRNSGCSYTA